MFLKRRAIEAKKANRPPCHYFLVRLEAVFLGEGFEGRAGGFDSSGADVLETLLDGGNRFLPVPLGRRVDQLPVSRRILHHDLGLSVVG